MYPSIITQPGSAKRNVQPITQALSTLIDDDISPLKFTRKNIIEIGSGDCTHLKHWSDRWNEIDWWPTGRNEDEVRVIKDAIKIDGSSGPRNIKSPLRLDIGLEDDWDRWEAEVHDIWITQQQLQKEETMDTSTMSGQEGVKPALFQGIIMINILHCVPADYPEKVFRHFSPLRSGRPDSSPVLDPDAGWIAAYSPFLADDGTYKSQGDEKFDKEYIQSKSNLLGLKTVGSISDIAIKWGFIEVTRQEMPLGNMWVVWKIKRDELKFDSVG